MQLQPPQAPSQTARPRAVTTAVLIYLVDLSVSLAYQAVDDRNLELPPPFELVMLGVLSFLVALEVALLWLVARGVNWSRYALAGLVVFVIVGYIAISDDPFEMNEYTTYTYFALLSTAAQVACVPLLFSKSAAPWFKRRPLVLAPTEF